MPLYDYKCTKCEHVFEIQQRITEEPFRICPKCNGPVRRLISPAGIVFKGSGFHVTDYKKGVGSRGQGGEKINQSSDHGVQNTGSKTKEVKSSAAASFPPKSK